MGGIPINAPGPVNPLPISDPALAVRKIPNLVAWITPDVKDAVVSGGVVQSVASRAGTSSGMIRSSGEPRLEYPAFPGLNSYPWLYLEDRGAVADYFLTSDPFDYSSAAGLTIISLHNVAGSYPMFGVRSGGASIVSATTNDTGYTQVYPPTGSVTFGPSLASANPHLHAWRFSGGTTLKVNVGNKVSGDLALALPSAPGCQVVFGARSLPTGTGMTGHIGEPLVFNRALTDAEIATIWAYFTATYGEGVLL